MAFSVNTNLTSLQAQEYLRMTSDFQGKTINRVTSGLRIISSGDDAAGLAIANGFRSDQAVLSQGVRNANDGLSTLQTIDGGISNISKLLDRARTLATQSASGTFTGQRTLLNSEFQSVVLEINRQAQAIGLDQNGKFAKSLSVFVGGGRENGGTTTISNGSIGVDLSKATVDARSLGLSGVQAIGVSGTDLGNGKVADILADSTNTAAAAVQGFSDFYFRGPGFADGSAVKVSVNLSGVTDAGTLVTALNAAIANAGNGTTAAATAFKNAGVTASTNVDANGKTRLAFSSSSAAFQVSAGDRTANALLGNITTNTGAATAQTVTGPGATVAAATVINPSTTSIILRFTGSSIQGVKDITLTPGATIDTALTALSSQVSNDSVLQAAGISIGAATPGSALTFTSRRGEKFSVEVVGDTANQLGYGAWVRNGSSFDYTTVTGGTVAAGASTLEFVVGETKFTVASTAAATGTLSADALNVSFAASTDAQKAGLKATFSGNTVILTSTNSTNFRVAEQSSNGVRTFGFGLGLSANSIGASSTPSATSATFDSGGAGQTSTLAFSSVAFGDESQVLTVNAIDAAGAARSAAITLANTGSDRSGRSIDSAIDAINNKLQQSNNATLQSIVAVKDNEAGTEKIRFISTLSSFQVSVGSTKTADGVGGQGAVASASVSAGGSNTDIGTQENAQAAVNTLASAVIALGNSQGQVGKGQNNLTYAVNLAQSQLSNLAAAESRIRDADLANEAANMTKAQILLQAGVAALAQANSAPQQILSLLRT